MTRTQDDPFGTAELRRRVLDGWADSPARFREDANAHEDYTRDGYHDRVIVELAQNAADAARRAGTTGKLHLDLDNTLLTAANTGAPLDADGVESLATLRASAKRDQAAATGRFGVGFSAAAAVSDDITATSRDGAVCWSLHRARTAVESELLETGRARSGLAEEIHRRGGDLPMLRLPFPAPHEPPPEGYDTAVLLRLRDSDARERVVELLDETSETLLLALPYLTEVWVTVDGAHRRITRSSAPDSPDVHTRAADDSATRDTRWRTVTRTGRLSPDTLADRPAEERARPDWAVTWAVPLREDGGPGELPAAARVVHAPTPSDAVLSLPALLIGTFPLTPDRRHIAAGPATDALLTEAAGAYCDLLGLLDARTALDLVPATPAAAGEFDGMLRSALTKPLQETPFLVTETGEPVRPRDAAVIDGGAEVTRAVSDLAPSALPGSWNPNHPALAQLRVRRVGLAELADQLADADREPEWWRRLYAALRTSGTHGTDLGDLGALPVPLADGRTVRSPRGLLAPTGPAFDTGDLDPQGLSPLGVRIVHPDAMDPLLLRLGAVEADEDAVLTDPLTREAVRNSLDADDPEEVTGPVLALAALAGTTAAEEPWLAELALRDSDGGYSPAGELLLPDSPLHDILTDDAPFGTLAADLVDSHGQRTLEKVGVVSTFTLVRATEVPLGPSLPDSLDGAWLADLDLWAREVEDSLGETGTPPVVTELVGVADLEFVRDDRWPQALELIAGSDELRAAVVEPARVVTGEGATADTRSYTAWWLRHVPVVDGREPAALRTAHAEPALAALYDRAPEGLDTRLALALGVRHTTEDLLAEPDGPDDLLRRLADPQRHVPRRHLPRLWAALARVEPDRVSPPEVVRAVRDGAVVTADAEEAVVVDAPDLLPLLAQRPVVLAPAGVAAALADVLDLALASEEVPGRVTTLGEVRNVPEEVRSFLDTSATTYVHHERLLVDGVAVSWRCGADALHASGVDGLARALCWAAGQWQRRHLVAAALHHPDTLPELLAETEVGSSEDV
ncbi:hypothetical protein FHX37_4383 [Haloactinospora alba]|uniref:Histidine kinase/DNA gyrase B/HSP90-like ATPase n=1 Tax=Haloactinospora alba TaxID=405555 RepID=A0A543N747_9ACTN|nr:ATP-binding protein [Haloactinospora alba]TQN27659.1 hypothetical protein FHX37_4383 [Haloactinospora alba]